MPIPLGCPVLAGIAIFLLSYASHTPIRVLPRLKAAAAEPAESLRDY